MNGHNRVDSSQTGAKGGRVRTKLDLNLNSRIYRWNRSCSLYHSTRSPLIRGVMQLPGALGDRLPISSSAPAIPLRMICNASASDLNPPLQMCRTFLRPPCISMPVCRGNTDISNNKSRSSFQLNSQALHVKAPNSSSVQYDRSTIIVLHDQNLLFICGFRQMHLLDGSAFRQVKFRLICVALSLALC